MREKHAAEKKIFAICDPEESYAIRMSEYLMEKVRIPYEIFVFTNEEELSGFLRKRQIEVLLLAQSAAAVLEKAGVQERIARIFILKEQSAAQEHEEGSRIWEIDKYQKPDKIVSELLEEAADLGSWTGTETDGAVGAKLIGIYSPIRRCLQTPFALTMGQILAREHRTLYLSFECYSGMRQLLNRDFSADIMDVMYYFRCAREKLGFRISSITQNINGLDFIPPVYSSLDFREVKGSQWAELCRELAAIGEYEYVLLDLDDGMNGLFDLLKECSRIYTITKDDRFATAKLTQYEQVLRYQEREDISDKTVRCRFPVFENVPGDVESMTHGELAQYVRAIIREDLDGI